MFALPWNVRELSRTLAGQNRKSRKETPISIRKRSLLFLTVDATMENKPLVMLDVIYSMD